MPCRCAITPAPSWLFERLWREGLPTSAQGYWSHSQLFSAIGLEGALLGTTKATPKRAGGDQSHTQQGSGSSMVPGDGTGIRHIHDLCSDFCAPLPSPAPSLLQQRIRHVKPPQVQATILVGSNIPTALKDCQATHPLHSRAESTRSRSGPLAVCSLLFLCLHLSIWSWQFLQI